MNIEKSILILALAAAPALAAASPEIAVHQTPASAKPIITIPVRSPLRERIAVNTFRIVEVLPMMVVLESVQKPHVTIYQQIGMTESQFLFRHLGEIARLKIVPVRGRP
jgi:hypothetical protein